MARIAPLCPPFDPPTEALLTKMMPPGVGVPPLAIFRLLARLPNVGGRLAAVGGALLSSPRLSLPIRELAILRTTARRNAEYEWGVHVTWLAAAAGLSEAQVAATFSKTLDVSQWSTLQWAVLTAVDQLVDTSTVDDATFAALHEHLDDDTILELVVVVGFYHLISFTVRMTQLPNEPWAASRPA